MISMAPKHNLISIARQVALLKARFKGQITADRFSLTWLGFLTPSTISEIYLVKVTYKLGKPPKVYIMSPPLDKSKGKIPHLYPDDSLCLYFPKSNRWNSSKYLGNTILLWASEWLFHYEIWFSTSVWNGGGISHS